MEGAPTVGVVAYGYTKRLATEQADRPTLPVGSRLAARGSRLAARGSRLAARGSRLAARGSRP
ncbi:hypothetical protein ACWD48_21240, partial [Streptomyces sp. NPDC002519]